MTGIQTDMNRRRTNTGRGLRSYSTQRHAGSTGWSIWWLTVTTFLFEGLGLVIRQEEVKGSALVWPLMAQSISCCFLSFSVFFVMFVLHTTLVIMKYQSGMLLDQWLRLIQERFNRQFLDGHTDTCRQIIAHG